MLTEWAWVLITGLGLAVTLRNSIEAKRTINAIRASRKHTELEKLAFLYVGYGKLIRQLGMLAAIAFNFAAGIMALSIQPAEARLPIVVAMLVASVAVTTTLSMIEAVRDDP